MTDIQNPAPCSQHGHRAGFVGGDARSNTPELPKNQATPERPKLWLLEWEPVGKGALVGRAKVRLPNGLEISDVALFAKDGRCWVQLQSEPMRDRDGKPFTDETGRSRYRSSIRWTSRELQDRFSTTVVELVLAAHPSAFGGGVP